MQPTSHLVPSIRVTFAMMFLLLLVAVGRAEPLVICGMAEVFVIDTAAAEKGKIEKLWSWQAKDHPELGPCQRLFGSTDDCKPIEDGKKILIASSGGACALVERPSGRATWYAHVPAAHSIELLPNDYVIAAASEHAQGNRLMLFRLKESDRLVWEDSLLTAHGVVWDPQRACLWALGMRELRAYKLKDFDTDHPALAKEASYPLPAVDGHDLQAVPGGNDLVLSTGKHVYLFDRNTREFRPHPELGDVVSAKCVSIHPTTGRVVFLHDNGKDWWNDEFGLLAPAGKIRVPGERFYKARWLCP